MISWYMQPKHSKKLEMLTKPFCKCFEVHCHQIKQIYKQYGTRTMLALQEEKDHIGTLVTWDRRFKGFGIKFRSNALDIWVQCIDALELTCGLGLGPKKVMSSSIMVVAH